MFQRVRSIAGLPWLIDRFKRYTILRQKVMADAAGLRDKLTTVSEGPKKKATGRPPNVPYGGTPGGSQGADRVLRALQYQVLPLSCRGLFIGLHICLVCLLSLHARLSCIHIHPKCTFICMHAYFSYLPTCPTCLSILACMFILRVYASCMCAHFVCSKLK